MNLWAVYDNEGDCVGVDVVANDEKGALAQFYFADNNWYAKIQDEATRASDMGEDFDPISDDHAMALITDIMSGSEWSADTLDAIAEVVRLTGREIADSDEYEDA